MTYNFDAERWYERELALIQSRRESGLLDEAAYHAALEDLALRYEAMLERLDGTFPVGSRDPSERES